MWLHNSVIVGFIGYLVIPQYLELLSNMYYTLVKMPDITHVYYIEMLHKITNKNAITLVYYLAQPKIVNCNTPVIG